jgi:hypothetical protein
MAKPDFPTEACFLLRAVLLLGLMCAGQTEVRADGPVSPSEFFLSPSGDDRAPGTAQQPVATFARATELAHQAALTASGPITVHVHGGVYRLATPWTLSAADSGTATAPIVFEAVANEKPVLSGAEILSEVQWIANSQITMRTEVPAGLTIDQLLINGELQTLARYPNAHLGSYLDDTTSLDEINKLTHNWYYPCAGAYLHGLNADHSGSFHVLVTGLDVNQRLLFKGGGAVNPRPEFDPKAMFIEGVRSEMDAPGEWFFDQAKNELYCNPPNVPYTDMTKPGVTTEIVRTKSLVRLQGTSNQPIHHLTLRGLKFTWTARTFVDDNESLVPGASPVARNGAVFIENAEDIAIEKCTFENLGGNALFISGHARRVAVRENEFSNILAGAVLVAGSSPANADSYPKDCTIEDNRIHNFGQLEKQKDGVLLARTQNITVNRNTIDAGAGAGSQGNGRGSVMNYLFPPLKLTVTNNNVTWTTPYLAPHASPHQIETLTVVFTNPSSETQYYTTYHTLYPVFRASAGELKTMMDFIREDPYYSDDGKEDFFAVAPGQSFTVKLQLKTLWRKMTPNLTAHVNEIVYLHPSDWTAVLPSIPDGAYEVGVKYVYAQTPSELRDCISKESYKLIGEDSSRIWHGTTDSDFVPVKIIGKD